MAKRPRFAARALLCVLAALLAATAMGASRTGQLPSYLRPAEDVLPTPPSTVDEAATAAKIEDILSAGADKDPIPEPRNSNPEPKEVEAEKKQEKAEEETGAAKQLEVDLAEETKKREAEAKKEEEKEAKAKEAEEKKAKEAEKKEQEAAKAQEEADRTGRGSASPDAVEYETDPKRSEPPADIKNVLDANSILVKLAKANAGTDGLDPDAEATRKNLDDVIVDEKVSGDVAPANLAEPLDRDEAKNEAAASAATGATSVTKLAKDNGVEYGGPQGNDEDDAGAGDGGDGGDNGEYGGGDLKVQEQQQQQTKNTKQADASGGDSDVKPTQSIQNATETQTTVDTPKQDSTTSAQPTKQISIKERQAQLQALEDKKLREQALNKQRQQQQQQQQQQSGSKCGLGRGAVDIITSELNCTTNRFERRGKSYRMSFHYKRQDKVRLTHVGNSLKVSSSDDLGFMESGCCDKERFDVVRLDIFSPSMHQIDDKQFPMELQIVHRGSSGTVTLAVLFDVQQSGGDNKFLSQLDWAKLPAGSGKTNDVTGCVDFEQLEQALQGSYYAYESGRCGNSWRVMKNVLAVSQQQLDVVRAAFPDQGKRQPEERAGRDIVLFERRSL